MALPAKLVHMGSGYDYGYRLDGDRIDSMNYEHINSHTSHNTSKNRPKEMCNDR